MITVDNWLERTLTPLIPVRIQVPQPQNLSIPLHFVSFRLRRNSSDMSAREERLPARRQQPTVSIGQRNSPKTCLHGSQSVTLGHFKTAAWDDDSLASLIAA